MLPTDEITITPKGATEAEINTVGMLEPKCEETKEKTNLKPQVPELKSDQDLYGIYDSLKK